jgi:hypothetical protein
VLVEAGVDKDLPLDVSRGRGKGEGRKAQSRCLRRVPPVGSHSLGPLLFEMCSRRNWELRNHMAAAWKPAEGGLGAGWGECMKPVPCGAVRKVV